MITFLLRRLIAAVVLLFVVTSVTFVIFFVVPKIGGQTNQQLAMQYMGKSPTPEAIADTIRQLGFDQPLYLQYWHYVSRFIAGADYNTGTELKHCSAPCLGFSFRTGQPILPDLLDRFPVTFSLAIGAAVLWVVGGVATGVLSALKRGPLFDRFAMGSALAGVSVPIFVTGPLVMLLLVFQTKLFQHPAYHSFLANPLQWAQGLLIPWFVLAFQFAALYARLTRAGMLDTMSDDYIRTARAKGLNERSVVLKHGLRAALTPIVTILGMDFGLLLGGAVLTETVFNLNGIGKMAIGGIDDNDLPVVLGVVLLAALCIIVANLIVDVLYGFVDPRVRAK